MHTGSRLCANVTSRNSAIVVAIMGALKAGAAVSLMDPTYPAERIINCLTVAQSRAWLEIEGGM